MATRKTETSRNNPGQRRGWQGWALGALAIGGVVAFAQGEAITSQAQAGVAYGARSACACRHIGGRELGSCQDDFVAGMGAVFLSENQAEQSVTATVPLIASDTARMRDGFGCVLDSWEG